MDILFSISIKGVRVTRRCWVNFQWRGVLLILITVGQEPILLAVGAGWGFLDNFSLAYFSSFLFPSLGDVRYKLKYCLKGPLNPNPSFRAKGTSSFFPLTYVRNKVDLGPLAYETDPRNDWLYRKLLHSLTARCHLWQRRFTCNELEVIHILNRGWWISCVCFGMLRRRKKNQSLEFMPRLMAYYFHFIEVCTIF